MLSPVQVLLLVFLMGLVYLYLKVFRNRPWGVFFVIVWLLAGCIAVLVPDITNEIARWLGVGRGADLMLYMLIITFLVITAVFHLRLRKIEEQQAQIIRHFLIEEKLNESSNED